MMQVFLPLPDFQASINVLDQARLGKQRVECYQLINAIEFGKGWKNHPAAVMFRQYLPALHMYGWLCCERWINLGFKDSLQKRFDYQDVYDLPWWMGGEIHITHQSNLIRKYPGHYKCFFKAPDNLEYYWPPEFKC